MHTFFKVVFSAFILFAGLSAQGQKLQGSFLKRGFVDSGSQILTFNDGNFTDTIYQHVTNAYGVGRYKLAGKRLRLQYLDVPNRDSSVYVLTQKQIDSTAGKLTVRFFLEGDAVVGEVQSLDAKGELLTRRMTNAQGTLTLNIEDVQDAQAVCLTGLFFYPVIIPKAQLLGRDTKVRVDFREVEKYYIRPGTKKFKVIKRSKDLLVLQSASGEEFIYDRQVL